MGIWHLMVVSSGKANMRLVRITVDSPFEWYGQYDNIIYSNRFYLHLSNAEDNPVQFCVPKQDDIALRQLAQIHTITYINIYTRRYI